MSIILDALRRGRGRQAPRQERDTAQTDAVLQTLGYGRFNPAAPLNRVKRLVGYVVLAIVFGLLLWGAVIWITQASLAPVTPRSNTPASQPASPPVRTSPQRAELPADSTHAPAAMKPIPDTASADPPVQPSVPAPPAAAAAAKPIPPAAFARTPPPLRAAVPDGVPSNSGNAASAAVTAGEDHFARGLMYQRLGDFENALVSYRQVLQRDEVNVEAHNNLGVLYRDKGLFDEAIRHFQRAIAIDPGYARARNNLGVVYLNQRKLDAAASQFHAALSIDGRNVESLVNLSTVDKESGRRDEARASLVRALAIDPRSPEAHYNLGLLEDEAGDASGALKHYRAFLQYGSATHPALVGDVRKRIDVLWPK